MKNKDNDEWLAEDFKQVSIRAIQYGLEDDGASETSRKKRSLRVRRRNLKWGIKHFEETLKYYKDQLQDSTLNSDLKEKLSEKISSSEEKIEYYKSRLKTVEENMSEIIGDKVIAPVKRRVAREDRRRLKKKRTKDKREMKKLDLRSQDIRSKLKEKNKPERIK